MSTKRNERGLGRPESAGKLLLWFVTLFVAAIVIPNAMRSHPLAAALVGLLLLALYIRSTFPDHPRERRSPATTYLQVAIGKVLQRFDPNNPDGHCTLGELLADSGRLDEAVDCFRKAIELKPDLACAHHDLGLALQRQGQHDPARQELAEAERLWTEEREAKAREMVIVHEKNGIAIVQVKGRSLDFDNSRLLNHHFAALLNQGRKQIILDLSKVRGLTAPGVGALVNALVQARKTAAGIKLVASSEVHETLKISGIASEFDIYSDEDAALSDFGDDSRANLREHT